MPDITSMRRPHLADTLDIGSHTADDYLIRAKHVASAALVRRPLELLGEDAGVFRDDGKTRDEFLRLAYASASHG